jgi:hypothetical protein
MKIRIEDEHERVCETSRGEGVKKDFPIMHVRGEEDACIPTG